MNELILVIAFVFGMGFWWLAIFEIIAVHSFWKFVFRIGIQIKKEIIEIESLNYNINKDKLLRWNHGKFLFSKNGIVYFTPYFFSINFFRISTPFPFKSIAIIKKNQIQVISRLPISTTFFFVFWIIGWTFASIEFNIQWENQASIGFGLIGWLIALIIMSLSYFVEQKRYNIMIKELKEILSLQNNLLNNFEMKLFK